jgi:hypothetical protein
VSYDELSGADEGVLLDGVLLLEDELLDESLSLLPPLPLLEP